MADKQYKYRQEISQHAPGGQNRRNGGWLLLSQALRGRNGQVQTEESTTSGLRAPVASATYLWTSANLNGPSAYA
ncbi:unnamed protein product [Clonostachys byssicola]|uniref:Uncharacterized protein n=1 Tax=Clonostachys byssicola TaxID=160290 RepID=A0A9N9US91_9HYPO|nr:unnamed protein product [Clonostachys byssicola]